MSEVKIPDYCEAITAYRMWTVDEKFNLRARHIDRAIWPARKANQAFCYSSSPFIGASRLVRTNHTNAGVIESSPQMGCSCGIYALKTQQMLKNYFSLDFSNTFHSGYYGIYNNEEKIIFAFGTVKLWGKLIEHKYGYRAEYAYPSEIFVLKSDLIDPLKAKYGVPVLIDREYALKFEEYEKMNERLNSLRYVVHPSMIYSGGNLRIPVTFKKGYLSPGLRKKS